MSRNATINMRMNAAVLTDEEYLYISKMQSLLCHEKAPHVEINMRVNEEEKCKINTNIRRKIME
jgi:hypothetical protein